MRRTRIAPFTGSMLIGLLGLPGLLGCRPEENARAPDASATRLEARTASTSSRGPSLLEIGPRMVSNQTRYPLMLYGRGFQPGSKLLLEGQTRQLLPTRFIDARHLTAEVPAGTPVARGRTSEMLQASVVGPDGRPSSAHTQLEMINDLELSTPLAMELSRDGARIFVASSATDQLWIFERAHPEKAPQLLNVGDGPRALGRWDSASGSWLVIGHQFSRDLWLIPADAPSPDAVRKIPLEADVQDLRISDGKAYVSSAILDRILVIDLASGKVDRRLPAGVNPRALAVDPKRKRLLACNFLGEDYSLLDLAHPETAEQRITAKPDTPILGGPTAKLSKYIMGSKAGRAVLIEPEHGLGLVGNIGPNIGPNPQRMEVTMNGGVSVLDLARRQVVRHLATGGVPESLALDPKRHLLYLADGSTGRVLVIDQAKLIKDDAAAKRAVLGSLEITPPPETPLIRKLEDFGVQGRSTTALHSGPRALRLLPSGDRLLLLNRFTRMVLELDVSKADRGQLSVVAEWRGPDHGELQRNRRLGEVVYYTDLGRSGMSCDSCHPEGHEGGILYSKSAPIRIYRSPTCREIKHSAPYFTPSRLPSIMATCIHVLDRNRYHNPNPTPEECRALVEYTEAIPTLPNPFVGQDGALPKDLELPDGHHGDALAGLGLFEGKAGCATESCHPPPHFTADQNPRTRGKWMNVGTPVQLGLRLEMQDTVDYGQPPVSLIGVWDSFPLLDSGAGGLSVQPDGTITPSHPFALRRVLEFPGTAPHGNTAALSARETDDLLAYLLTL